MRHLIAFLSLAGWLVAAGIPSLLAPGDATIHTNAPARPSERFRELLARNNALTLARAEAEARFEKASRELEQARAETQSYRRGLERAVGELNRQARQPPSPPLTLNGPRRARRPKPSSGIQRLEVKPSIQILGDQVWVRGQIRNREGRLLSGRLTVELRLDGRRLDSGSRPLEILAGSSADWEHKFMITGYGAANLTAAAHFDYR